MRGALLAGAGSLLLANAGDGYAYRHVDDGGDRSLVLAYDGALLASAARSMGLRLDAARPFRGGPHPRMLST